MYNPIPINGNGYKPYKPNLAERTFDKVIGTVYPRAAYRNAVYRERIHAFGYEGARITRFRENATRAGTIGSNTPLNSADRVQLVWEARDLGMNDPFIHGLLDRFADYVIGPEIRLEVHAGNPGDEAMIHDYLLECMENCDLSERSDLTEYGRLALISTLRDGDFGSTYNEVPSPAGEAYIRLGAIEGDTIGGYHYWLEPGVVSGVEFDRVTAKPLAYRIYPRNNYGYYEANYNRVPADQFCFLAYRQRTDAYRGIPSFASAISTARDIHEILQNEKMGVKWATSWAGFVKTAGGSADTNDPSAIYQPQGPAAAPDPGGNPGPRYYEDFHPAQIGYLATGESVDEAKSDRPSPSFNGFLALLYRHVCLSLGMPFGFAFDTSILGGVPARLESAQAKRTFERWQHFMFRNFFKPTFRRWIAHGIVTGRIRMQKLVVPKVFVSWPAHPTVDVGRESRANVTEFEAGVKSFSAIVREQGKDPLEEINRIADDAAAFINAFKSRGLPVELVKALKTETISSGRGQGGASGGGSGSGSSAGVSST